ncbi:MAG: FkbM family methyltransferase [Candidatus Contendobacter sp.]|jgi:FkbM family methyltransferase|nr:FkbM family methyltransferase [Candidatus Contendobacter sp.]
MLTSPWLVHLRTLTRKLGLNKLVGRLIAGSRYEDRFGPAVRREVRPGDTVWDIGANLGLYTVEFLQQVGPSGQVVAFEPVAACFAQLRERLADSAQVKLKNMAVGDTDGQISMSLEVDPLAATHRVVESGAGGGGAIVQVEVRSSASIVAEEPELFPNVVKIDVEGHEGAVMDGMQSLLPDRRLRCVGIEVHFGLLDERGESARPKQIEQTLARHGFQVRWTDPSHLLAVR